MTEERFRALAAAYGADPDRWPDAERSSAAAFLSARPAVARPILAAERRLDEALAAYAAAEPDSALRARIVAAAPRERRVGRVARWLAGAGLGLGLAASCAAGVAAGFAFAPSSLSHMLGRPAPTGADLSPLASPADDAAGG